AGEGDARHPAQLVADRHRLEFLEELPVVHQFRRGGLGAVAVLDLAGDHDALQRLGFVLGRGSLLAGVLGRRVRRRRGLLRQRQAGWQQGGRDQARKQVALQVSHGQSLPRTLPQWRPLAGAERHSTNKDSNLQLVWKISCIIVRVVRGSPRTQPRMAAIGDSPMTDGLQEEWGCDSYTGRSWLSPPSRACAASPRRPPMARGTVRSSQPRERPRQPAPARPTRQCWWTAPTGRPCWSRPPSWAGWNSTT